MSEVKFSKKFDYSKIDRGKDWRLKTSKERKADSLKLSKKLNKFNCPICNGKEYSNIVKIYNFDYVQCIDCKHVFLEQIPSQEIINNFYRDKNLKINKSPGDDLINTDSFNHRVENICIPKVEFVLDSLKIKAPKWVDIGCGVGDMVYAANQLGCIAIGYDVDEREIEHGKSFGSNVVKSEIDKSNAKELIGDADVISLVSVLEHVSNPIQLLNIITDNMKLSAKIIIEVPRFESLSSIINIVFPTFIARHMLPPNHLMLFTEESLEAMLKNVNLRRTSSWYYGMDINELFGTVFALGNSIPQKLSKKLASLSNELQSSFDKNKFCDEILLIASNINCLD